MPRGVYIRNKDKLYGMTGKHHTEKSNQKNSESHKNKIPWNKGKHYHFKQKRKNGHKYWLGKQRYEETKNKLSEIGKTKLNEKSSAWKGGKKLSIKRRHEKRRELGYIFFNKPFENSVGHHININYVLYIPEYLHKGFYHNVRTGKNMIEINSLILLWLILSVEINNIIDCN